jgi:exosortase E/protease (VPEID-CTERM system)
MISDSPPSVTPSVSEAPPWRDFRLKTALIVFEGCLLAGVFNATVQSVPARLFGYEGLNQSKILFLLVTFGLYLRSHVSQYESEYRTRRLSPPLLLLNGIAFIALMAWLAAMAAGIAEPALGARPTLLVAAGLMASWAVTCLAMWVARFDRVPRIVGAIAFLVGGMLLASRAGALTQQFWKMSSGPTMTLVEFFLTPLAGGAVIRPEPEVIGTEVFSVHVHRQCSGYQGIGLITVLLAGYLWWFREIHRFPQSFLLFPVAIVLIWLANSLRIAALILVGIYISPEIAVDGFHSNAGWITFLVVGLGIIWAAQRLPFFTIEPAAAEGSPTSARGGVTGDVPELPAGAVGRAFGPSAAACLLPFLVLTGAAILTGAFTSGFDLLYPVRVIAVAATLWSLRDRFSLPPSGGWIVSPGAIGIGACVFAMWMALAPGAEAATEEKLLAMDPTNLGEPWTTLWLIVRVLGSTVTVPIAEELAFRGFLSRRCIDEDVERVPVGTFTWLSFLASSLAFGLLHGGAWIAGTVAGMAFAVALYQRRRLADAIAAHATTNALLSGYVIATGSWTQWG